MINGHKSIVMAFSGGKDSLACLFLMRPYLERITVLFVDTGKCYPEQLEMLELAKSIAPHVEVIKTDRDAQWAAHGIPSAVVPIDWTGIGQKVTHGKHIRIQSYLQCCYENISLPITNRAKELGATLIISGQRSGDHHRAARSNGSIVDGIEHYHPIEGWSREDVLNYLSGELGGLPQHLLLDHSSMDCYDCTAYPEAMKDRMTYASERHPEMDRAHRGHLRELLSAMDAALEPYRQVAE